jgi:hypothetical protein
MGLTSSFVDVFSTFMPTRARISGHPSPKPARRSALLVASAPRWMQVLAVFCMALVLGATTAQASHLHGVWSPGHAPELTHSDRSAPANDEADCPLCMVLHAALAPALIAGVQPVAPMGILRVMQVSFAPELVCHFPARSRPPPAQA